MVVDDNYYFIIINEGPLRRMTETSDRYVVEEDNDYENNYYFKIN